MINFKQNKINFPISYLPIFFRIFIESLQRYQPRAAGPTEDAAPKYENPPNYEEALELMNGEQQQKKLHNSPIT